MAADTREIIYSSKENKVGAFLSVMQTLVDIRSQVDACRDDVDCGMFDGDDTKRGRERIHKHSVGCRERSECLEWCFSCLALSHLTAATPIRCEEAFFPPSIKITHVNTLETIVHADSIY